MEKIRLGFSLINGYDLNAEYIIKAVRNAVDDTITAKDALTNTALEEYYLLDGLHIICAYDSKYPDFCSKFMKLINILIKKHSFGSSTIESFYIVLDDTFSQFSTQTCQDNNGSGGILMTQDELQFLINFLT
ncbi:hypothetical protein D3C78_17950 [compost metagenome]